MKRIIAGSVLALFIVVFAFLLLTSPLADGLFEPGNDTLVDLFALLLTAAAITAGASVCIAVIVACCQIAKRLGYESHSGLLMLVPVVNLVALFCWAFRESPNERLIRRLKETDHQSQPSP